MSPSAPARWFARPLLGLVWLYRITLSPWLGPRCRFQPTCSTYAEQALKRYGAFRGGWLTVRRIARCHPWGGSGYDPVPPIDAAPVPGEIRAAGKTAAQGKPRADTSAGRDDNEPE